VRRLRARAACERACPGIASGGAGKLGHFSDVFKKTTADAALAASIFHYREIPIREVKEYLLKEGIEVRL